MAVLQASAMADSVPMVVISSEVPGYWLDRPSRQYSHQVRDVSQVVDGTFAKASFHITDADEVYARTMQAVALARTGRPGPVHLNVGIDVLKAPVTTGTTETGSGAGAAKGLSALSHTAAQLLKEAAGRIAQCDYPLIVAGGGCKAASSTPDLVRLLAERLQAPVLTTVGGKGTISDAHGLSAGTRLHFPSMQEALLAKADGLLLLGTQVSPTDYWQFKHDEEVPVVINANTLHVNIDPQNIQDVNVEAHGGIALEIDVDLACQELLAELGAVDSDGSGKWDGDAEGHVQRAVDRTDSKENMTDHLMFDFTSDASGGDQMRRTLGMLRGALGNDSPLVADVCRIGYTALSAYPVPGPRNFIYPVGTTTLGPALPMAIGAALAKPGKCVGLVAGDGGFQFTMPELSVAVAQQLPLLILVWNDASYGEIRRSLPTGFATQLQHNPEFEMICSAYGIPHFRVDDCKDLHEVLLKDDVAKSLQGQGGPVMIEVCRTWDGTPIEQMSTESQPGLVLGTMTFGWAQASRPIDVSAASNILSVFTDRPGCTEVDTARLYAGGEGEGLLAAALAKLPKSKQAEVKVATKVNPAGACGEADVTGGFAKPALVEQALESFQALQTDAVDMFYLHWPDRAVPLEEALEQVQGMYDQGKFQRLGLSNFSAPEVATICEVMAQRGWVAPAVYQGLYNAISRDVESDLFPVLRDNNMSFYAYNPLAGGLLTGKHDFSKLTSTEGRFKDNDFYYERYGKQDIFAALTQLMTACKEENVGMADASLRWLMHHSALAASQGDKLIIGCSSVDQLQQNLASCLDHGGLPSNLTDAFDRSWDVAEKSSAVYASYGTSGSMLKPTSIRDMAVNDGGTEVKVTFGDGEQFFFRSTWLADSSPQNASMSFTRIDPDSVLRNIGIRITDVAKRTTSRGT
jgi:aflatoxin B1 aldehyde reductase